MKTTRFQKQSNDLSGITHGKNLRLVDDYEVSLCADPNALPGERAAAEYPVSEGAPRAIFAKLNGKSSLASQTLNVAVVGKCEYCKVTFRAQIAKQRVGGVPVTNWPPGAIGAGIVNTLGKRHWSLRRLTNHELSGGRAKPGHSQATLGRIS